MHPSTLASLANCNQHLTIQLGSFSPNLSCFFSMLIQICLLLFVIILVLMLLDCLIGKFYSE
jgi:hypothetical protein